MNCPSRWARGPNVSTCKNTLTRSCVCIVMFSYQRQQLNPPHIQKKPLVNCFARGIAYISVKNNFRNLNLRNGHNGIYGDCSCSLNGSSYLMFKSVLQRTAHLPETNSHQDAEISKRNCNNCHPTKLGVAQTVLLVNRVLSPAKKGPFDENSKNDEFAFYPLKTRASLLRPRKRRKWRVSLRQSHGLEKAGFVLP